MKKYINKKATLKARDMLKNSRINVSIYGIIIWFHQFEVLRNPFRSDANLINTMRKSGIKPTAAGVSTGCSKHE